MDSDELSRSGAANYWYNSVAIGGKLILRSGEIEFVPHGLNLDRNVRMWRVADVESVKHGGALRNKLTLRIRGVEHRFVVFKAASWAKAIESAAAEAARP